MQIDEINNIACQIIAYAGDAKSMFLEALDEAEKNDIEKAEKIMKDAEAALTKAHEVHTQLLVMEARDPDSVKMTMMLVHASDHLTSAENAQIFTERLLKIYKGK